MIVRRRPEKAEDERFIRDLIVGAIGDELGAWSWPEALRGPLLEQQYSLRRQAARVGGAGRSSQIVEADGAAAGWICVADLGEEVRLVDIIVAPEYRNKGLGAWAVHSVIQEAGGRPVRLNVTAANPRAIAFYQRLGFERTGGDGVQHFLERRP